MNFRKIFNILLLINRNEDEAENLAYLHRTLPSTIVVFFFYSRRMRTLVAMATYSFNRLIMGKVEIGNFYCLIGDNRILFLQKCLLNSSPLL